MKQRYESSEQPQKHCRVSSSIWTGASVSEAVCTPGMMPSTKATKPCCSPTKREDNGGETLLVELGIENNGNKMKEEEGFGTKENRM